MKIDWTELKRGLDKESNWLTDTYQGAKDGVVDTFRSMATGVGNTVNNVVDNIPGVQAAKTVGNLGNIAKSVGGAAVAGLPLLAGLGGRKSGAGGAPSIHIDLGRPKSMLGFAPGEVRSMSSPKLAEASGNKTKTANLLDPSVLRTVLLSRVTNDIMDQAAQNKAMPVEDQKVLDLVSKYPEMQKMLAEPQTKAYLENLLTKKSHKHTDEKDIHSES